MITGGLLGTLLYRRYQRMRTVILETAAELGVQIELEEIYDTERLSQSNPFDLPQLYLDEELIASRNPPNHNYLIEQFQKAKE